MGVVVGGSSLQLVAYINGERVDATEMAHWPWRDLVKHPRYAELVLIECGLRAKRVTSHMGRQYFAHYPSLECPVVHKSESPQHLAMKQALKDRINAAPGWTAEVEAAHPERAWTADVLATNTDGRRLAFEVQLSQQTEEEFVRRSQRYVDDRIGPVWVVPKDFDWFRVQLPMIVTGFGKTSDLPGDPAELMELLDHQPLIGKMARSGAIVDAVLQPRFKWPHGTPRHQWDTIQRLEAERAEAGEAARVKAAQEAKARQLVGQEEVQRKAEKDSLFAVQAVAPDVGAVPAVKAGMNVWGSIVRCSGSGHPFLIWRLLEPPARIDLRPYRPGPESLDRVLVPVEAWLQAAGGSLVRGKLVTVNRPGKPLGFVCPTCNDLVQGRWVSSIPNSKWSAIAEHTQAEVDVPKPPEPGARHGPPREQTFRAQTVHRPARIEEGHSEFIGPRPWALWMSEARDATEIAARQAAKDARAARLREISENPRYIGSVNGFRFQCSDCGGTFEDDNEGIHANAQCLARGGRNPAGSWR